MAKKSSSKAVSTGNTPAVPAGEVTYEEVLARGTDIDALLREYVAAQGPAGLLGLAHAVNTFPVQADTHEAMAVVCACETLKSVVTATQAQHAISYQLPDQLPPGAGGAGEEPRMGFQRRHCFGHACLPAPRSANS